MGYACPVCDTPQRDGEHLAHHLAFTAMIHGDDHAAWLDEHAPGWEQQDPAGLASDVTLHAEDAEYHEVFEDTTDRGRPDVDVDAHAGGHDHQHGGGRGHQHAGGHDHQHGGHAGGESGGSPGVAAPEDADEETREALREARELTREMLADDGDDDAGEASGADGDADDDSPA